MLSLEKLKQSLLRLTIRVSTREKVVSKIKSQKTREAEETKHEILYSVDVDFFSSPHP